MSLCFFVGKVKKNPGQLSSFQGASAMSVISTSPSSAVGLSLFHRIPLEFALVGHELVHASPVVVVVWVVVLDVHKPHWAGQLARYDATSSFIVVVVVAVVVVGQTFV